MNLTTLLEKEQITRAKFADRTGISKPSVTNHLAYEAGTGTRPLGLELCSRAMEVFPALTLADLRPDLAATVNRILEAQENTPA